MAEEVIHMQESLETVSEPMKMTEPRGTVISMESVKPAVVDQEEPQRPAEASEPLIQVQAQEEAQETAEARESTENVDRSRSSKAAFHKPPIFEKKRDLQPDAQLEEAASDKEKKRIQDFFHFRKDIDNFSREDWILSRIREEDLMEYLTMEQNRNEMLQKAKDVKEKRIFTTLQIAITMSAIVGVVALLKDNPIVLVNILYITGIVIALWIWRGKQDK